MHIAEQLKLTTQRHHDALEAAAGSEKIISGQLTLAELASLIYKTYLLHHYLEENMSPLLCHQLDFQARSKTLLLKRDVESLKAFYVFPEPLNIQLKIQAIFQGRWETVSDALGCLYVLEGSTLGGQVISKALKRNPNTSSFRSYYYGCYGAQIGKMWLELKAELEKLITTPKDAKRAIASASATFKLFKAVFEMPLEIVPKDSSMSLMALKAV